jgi:hypothetical protein
LTCKFAGFLPMIASRMLIVPFVSAGLLALAGCGSGDASDAAAKSEAAGLELAMAPPMTIDADLTTRNLAESAIAGGGPPVIALPPFERGSDAAAAAKADAEKLSGGPIASAPSSEGDVDPVLREAVAAGQRAGAIKGPGRNCGTKADYALAWSLQLPGALPIYPRGALIEAAGSDRDGCRLRVVRFVTPVSPDAIVDFYHARGRAAGFSMRHRADEETRQLTGSKGTGEFAVQARKRDDGLTEADIVANGV